MVFYLVCEWNFLGKGNIFLLVNVFYIDGFCVWIIWMVEMKGGGWGLYDVMVVWFYRYGSCEKGWCCWVVMMYIWLVDIGW